MFRKKYSIYRRCNVLYSIMNVQVFNKIWCFYSYYCPHAIVKHVFCSVDTKTCASLLNDGQFHVDNGSDSVSPEGGYNWHPQACTMHNYTHTSVDLHIRFAFHLILSICVAIHVFNATRNLHS